MSDQPMAAEACEHYWAYHVHDGMSVRLCQHCHEPDWDDVRRELEKARADAVRHVTARQFASEIDAATEKVMAEKLAGLETRIRAGERERIAAVLEAYAGNYPEDVFRPSSGSRDAIAGTAMRHAYGNAARMVREAGDD